MTDANGNVTSFTYDGQGNKTSMTDAGYVPASGIPSQNTTYYGNAAGQGGYNLANQPVLVTYPKTGQTGTGYATMTTQYLYPGGPQVSMSNANKSSNVVRTVTTTYGPEGETLGTSGSAETVGYQYDALYRRAALTDGDGHATRYFYTAAGYLDTILPRLRRHRAGLQHERRGLGRPGGVGQGQPALHRLRRQGAGGELHGRQGQRDHVRLRRPGEQADGRTSRRAGACRRWRTRPTTTTPTGGATR